MPKVATVTEYDIVDYLAEPLPAFTYGPVATYRIVHRRDEGNKDGHSATVYARCLPTALWSTECAWHWERFGGREIPLTDDECIAMAQAVAGETT